MSEQDLVPNSGGSSGVSSVNGETGSVTLTSTGGTIAITTPSGSTINLETVGGGSGAPVNATYLTLTNNAGLTANRTIAVTANLSMTDGGATNPLTIGTGAFTGDITTSANSFATTIGANKVTYAKMQQASTVTLLGNPTGGTANISEITLGSGLAFSGTTLIATGGGTGTVTTVSVATANGFSGTVATPTTTPVITIIAGAITPTSVNSIVFSGSSTPTLAVTGTSSISGANTGDQTITLTGDVTGSGTGSFAATIGANKVTYAKMQQASTVTLLGNPTGGTANISEITLGSGLAFSGTTLTATGGGSGTVTTTGSPASGNLTKFSGATSITNGDLSGDVTTSGTLATTIANNAVTYAKLQTETAYSVLGNNTGSTANSSAIQYVILGTPTYTTAGFNLGQITASANTYAQVAIQNTNSGSSASTDFVVTADDGTDSIHYADFGINGSTGATTPFAAAHAAYLYSVDNEFDIGALGASGVINFYTTGGTTPVKAGFFDATQNLNLTNALKVAQGGTGAATLTAYAPLFGGTTTTNPIQSGTVGTAGQVLTSNGAGALPTFQPSSGGGGGVSLGLVCAVAAGNLMPM